MDKLMAAAPVLPFSQCRTDRAQSQPLSLADGPIAGARSSGGRAGRLLIPGQPFVELMDLGAARDNAFEDVAKAGLRDEPIDLGRVDQKKQNRSPVGDTPPSLPPNIEFFSRLLSQDHSAHIVQEVDMLEMPEIAPHRIPTTSGGTPLYAPRA